MLLKGRSNREATVCNNDFFHNTSICKVICPPGSFSLHGMKSCHPWLTCDADIIIHSLISASVVKTVYLAEWKGFNVVLSVLSSSKFKEDFLHNLFMVKSFSPNEFVVQLVGYCENSLLTEYHELGSALNTQYHLKHSLKVYDNVKTRLKLCISYASVIRFLHNSSIGVRVMCDSNTLEKALSQYLLSSDLKLVANDLDATPAVKSTEEGIHCGNRELTGLFIAPEQKWPYPEREFDIKEMPLYNEKTDIFKVPDICNWFLGNSPGVDVIKYKLFNIHKRCKSTDPRMRPNADDIVRIYENIFLDFS